MAGSVVSMAVNTNYTEAFDCNGLTLVGVHVPTGFNGGTLTLKTCLTVDGTYYSAEDGAGANTVVTIGAAPSYVSFDPATTKGIRYVKLVSNTNANANFDLTLAVSEV